MTDRRIARSFPVAAGIAATIALSALTACGGGYKAPELFPEDIPEPVYKRIQESAVAGAGAGPGGASAEVPGAGAGAGPGGASIAVPGAGAGAGPGGTGACAGGVCVGTGG